MKRKNKFAYLVCISFMTFACSQNMTFKIKDNIVEYCNRNPPKYLTSGPTLLNIPEGTQNFLKYKQGTTPEDIKFLENNQYIVGVLQNIKGDAQLLYDLNGDGLLDSSVPIQIVPFWILSKSINTQKSLKNNVDSYLDTIFDLLNGNENPYNNDLLNNKINNLYIASLNPTTMNRDILYGVFLYYLLLRKDSSLDYLNLIFIQEAYQERFQTKKNHPLLLLYTIETLINLGDKDSAIKQIEWATRNYPDFIPFQVYSWQLEKNNEIKKSKYSTLKNKYPLHWIVRQI